MVEWWTRKDHNKIVVASVKERENNKIVGAMAMVEEGRQHNHGGVGEEEGRQ